MILLFFELTVKPTRRWIVSEKRSILMNAEMTALQCRLQNEITYDLNVARAVFRWKLAHSLSSWIETYGRDDLAEPGSLFYDDYKSIRADIVVLTKRFLAGIDDVQELGPVELGVVFGSTQYNSTTIGGLLDRILIKQ